MSQVARSTEGILQQCQQVMDRTAVENPLTSLALQKLTTLQYAVASFMRSKPLETMGMLSLASILMLGCINTGTIEIGLYSLFELCLTGVLMAYTVYPLAQLIFSENRSPLIGVAKEEVDGMLEGLLETSDTPTLQMCMILANPHTNIDQKLVKYALNFHSDRVQRAPLAERFVYEITYQGVVVAHLIGTMHKISKVAAQDRQLHALVERSQQLIVETPYIIQLPPQDAEKYAVLDSELMKTAQVNSVPIVGLESLETQKKLVEEMTASEQPRTVWKTVEQAAFEDACALYGNELMQDTYRRADSQGLYSVIQMGKGSKDKKLLGMRNLYWLAHLVPMLKDPSRTKPLCIAVGAGHCLGKQEGLVWELRRDGFVVTKKSY